MEGLFLLEIPPYLSQNTGHSLDPYCIAYTQSEFIIQLPCQLDLLRPKSEIKTSYISPESYNTVSCFLGNLQTPKISIN